MHLDAPITNTALIVSGAFSTHQSKVPAIAASESVAGSTAISSSNCSVCAWCARKMAPARIELTRSRQGPGSAGTQLAQRRTPSRPRPRVDSPRNDRATAACRRRRADRPGHAAQLRDVEVQPPVKRFDDRPELGFRRHEAAEERALASFEQVDEDAQRLRRHLFGQHLRQVRPSPLDFRAFSSQF